MRSVHVLVRSAAVLTTAALLVAGAASAPASKTIAEPKGGHTAYRFTDVGVLGGLDSRAYALSSSGFVAGLGDTDPETGPLGFHAFRWTPNRPGGTAGFIDDLGALGEGQRSAAAGVNARGVTVGVSLPDSGGSKAFVFTRTMRRLPSLGGSAEAAAIGDGGRIAGSAVSSGGSNHAVLWLPKRAGHGPTHYRVVDLGVPRGWVSSSAMAFNAGGQVVGAVGDADFYSHAALWTPHHAHGLTGRWTELGVLRGGDGSVARDINRRGVVVGQSTSGHGDRGFVYNGQLRGLPPLRGGTESFAFAIDDHGVIVGYADGARAGGDHAVMWRNRKPVDLNTWLPAWARDAGYVLRGAYDINDRGQIVGVADLAGHAHGFLLTPRTATAAR